MKLTFFKSQRDFRKWLEAHHATAKELWVGFYKKDSGKLSITWPESVDEALCFGWIDGVRKAVDEVRYCIRFSPRRAKSVWSAANIRRARELQKKGLMHPAGVEAFGARQEYRSGIYSYENRPSDLPDAYTTIMKRNKAAWTFFRAQPPGIRRTQVWWILSAKKEETRLRRLDTLVLYCVRGERLPALSAPRVTPR